MSIFDTMNFIKPQVSTLCMGMAASMGAFLLKAGEKGKRFALPNSKIMIHQPLGGTQGQATDIEIHARDILKTRAQLNQILADRTGTLWLAGERGLLLQSVDRGLTWEQSEVPNDAPSLYGLLRLGSGELLVHGLRGHAWRVNAQGQVTDVAIETPVMLAASCRLNSGAVLLAGAARWFFISEDDGRTFNRIVLPLTTAVAELLPLPDGRVLALGEAGISVLRMPPRR
jgi:hypothetical protein